MSKLTDRIEALREIERCLDKATSDFYKESEHQVNRFRTKLEVFTEVYGISKVEPYDLSDYISISVDLPTVETIYISLLDGTIKYKRKTHLIDQKVTIPLEVLSAEKYITEKHDALHKTVSSLVGEDSKYKVLHDKRISLYNEYVKKKCYLLNDLGTLLLDHYNGVEIDVRNTVPDYRKCVEIGNRLGVTSTRNVTSRKKQFKTIRVEDGKYYTSGNVCYELHQSTLSSYLFVYGSDIEINDYIVTLIP